MTTRRSILAWRLPWTEKPGGLQFMGSHRLRLDWVTDTHRPYETASQRVAQDNTLGVLTLLCPPLPDPDLAHWLFLCILAFREIRVEFQAVIQKACSEMTKAGIFSSQHASHSFNWKLPQLISERFPAQQGTLINTWQTVNGSFFPTGVSHCAAGFTAERCHSV